MDEIDRNSFEPAYNQLVNILRRKISTGAYRPGDRLPSEAELCSQYQVSSITARRAIKILVEQAVADTVPGRGTFVRSPMLGTATFDLEELQGVFSDDRTAVRIKGAWSLSADGRTARKLAVPAGTRVIYIHRLIFQEGIPVIYHREYVIYDPKLPTVEAEMEVTALRGLFDGSGATALKRGDLSIEATVLNEDEAAIMQMPHGSPAFRLEHIFYDFDDRPTSWGWFICRGDRFKFKTTVGVSEPSLKTPSDVKVQPRTNDKSG